MIFQWIIRFFRGMGAPGFGNVKQKKIEIRH